MTCPTCGRAHRDGVRYCTFCGTSVAPEQDPPPLCPSCGQTSIDQEFCPICGQQRFRRSPPGLKAGVYEFIWETWSLSLRIAITCARLIVPGLLTWRYARGRTNQDIKPMKLYLVSFGFMAWVMGAIVDSVMDRPGLLPMPRSETIAEWAYVATLILSFFLPLLLMLLLHLLWGRRRENYAFALHANAFMAFIALPLGANFFGAALIWTVVGACVVYGTRSAETSARAETSTTTETPARAYSIGGVLVRSLATAALFCTIFLFAFAALGFLHVAPTILPAMFQQPVRAYP